MSASYGDLPLTFIENRGQTDSRVRFHVQGPGHGIYLTKDEIALTLRKPSGEGVALDLRFVDANPNPALTGDERAPGEVNYLVGNDPSAGARTSPATRTSSTASCGRASTSALRGQDGALKYEFRVHPGARPSRHPARLPRRERAAARQRRRAADRDRRSARCTTPRRSPTRTAARASTSRYALARPARYGFAIGALRPHDASW